MQITQNYTRPSSSTTDAKGTHFNLSAEQSRGKVSLNAMINNSLSYARLMLMMRRVVVGDWRTPQVDHSKYQEWLQGQYLRELPRYFPKVTAKKLDLLERQQQVREEIKKLNLQTKYTRAEVNRARTAYYNYLRVFEKDKWYALDPVISVHPDCVIFEAFSLDESSYARLSVPQKNLEIFGPVTYGTTNIDFSAALAAEISRVRNYRPAWLKVAYEQVELSTSSGSSIEKKIDLPDTWVRGFLQVQSAATLPGINVRLSANTFHEVLSVLQQNKARTSPRSLRFQLKKGECPSIIIDPWGIEIKEFTHCYQGTQEGEIKIWGRRRLSIFNEMLAYADYVDIKLLGTGMPSYWTLSLDGHRFDLGLSGWTANDWAKRANFDLLAAANRNPTIDLQKLENKLIEKLAATPKELAEELGFSQKDITFALQELCRKGQAMYDHLSNQYRWRQLLQQDIKLQPTASDERMKYAIELLKNNKINLTNQWSEKELLVYQAQVTGKNIFKTEIKMDADGRIKQANCSCGFFRRNKLRQGPCSHLVATTLSVSR